MKNLGALVLVVTLAACSSATADAPTSPTTGATVTLRASSFDPGTITVKVGETVKWNWSEGTHNVVSGTNCTPDAKFSSGDPVEGGTFEQKFDTAGTFEYFCSVHCSAGMVGKVIVQ